MTIKIGTNKHELTNAFIMVDGVKRHIIEIKVPTSGGNKSVWTAYDDKTKAPGPKRLKKGTMQEGFFGVFPNSEIMDGKTIAAKTGLTEGSLLNNDTDWLKFAWKGKILLRPQKPVRNNFDWDMLNEKGLVFGTEIEHNGVKYKVRLHHGAVNDPFNNDAPDKEAKGSEYNRLILPLFLERKNNSWVNPEYVESDLSDWGAYYTHAEMGVVSDSVGCQVLCIESRKDRPVYHSYRGGVRDSVSLMGSKLKTVPQTHPTFSTSGWIPILEVIE